MDILRRFLQALFYCFDFLAERKRTFRRCPFCICSLVHGIGISVVFLLGRLNRADVVCDEVLMIEQVVGQPFLGNSLFAYADSTHPVLYGGENPVKSCLVLIASLAGNGGYVFLHDIPYDCRYGCGVLLDFLVSCEEIGYAYIRPRLCSGQVGIQCFSRF